MLLPLLQRSNILIVLMAYIWNKNILIVINNWSHNQLSSYKTIIGFQMRLYTMLQGHQNMKALSWWYHINDARNEKLPYRRRELFWRHKLKQSSLCILDISIFIIPHWRRRVKFGQIASIGKYYICMYIIYLYRNVW